MDKNAQIVNYFLTCPQIQDSPLYFNFIHAEDSTTQILTDSNDIYATKKYIDGSELNLYNFTIIMFRSVSPNAIARVIGYPNENIVDLADIQALIDWVTEQNELKNFPNFGENCIVQSIKSTTLNPIFSGIDTEVSPNLAVYNVTFQVEYLDISKKIWR